MSCFTVCPSSSAIQFIAALLCDGRQLMVSNHSYSRRSLTKSTLSRGRLHCKWRTAATVFLSSHSGNECISKAYSRQALFCHNSAAAVTHSVCNSVCRCDCSLEIHATVADPYSFQVLPHYPVQHFQRFQISHKIIGPIQRRVDRVLDF